jgi:hypothetical protein
LPINWEKVFFSKKVPPCGGTSHDVSPVLPAWGKQKAGWDKKAGLIT